MPSGGLGLRRRGHLHRLRVVRSGRCRHSRHAHADVLPGVVQPRADFRDVDDVVSGRGAGDDGGRGETREGQPESLAHPSFARVGVHEGGVDRPGSPGRGAFPGAFRSLLNCFLDGSRSPRRGEDPEPARRGEGEAHRLKGLRGGRSVRRVGAQRVCDNDSSAFRDSVAGSGLGGRKFGLGTLADWSFRRFRRVIPIFGDLIVSLTISQCTSAHLYSLSRFFPPRIGKRIHP